MANVIRIKRSNVADIACPTSDLVSAGELAVNTADKRLFTNNSTSAILEIGSNPHNVVGSGGFQIANGNITFPNADVQQDIF